ncbi:phage tail tape measure protein [Haemophilus haemolyticus]|uniref:phage tail tape measure protein n=1 Tax=Haemophilus haemolyticus TaxID=726 RepID=UPI00112CB50A|nr:phage tail tape measure protein [Haemophilus haemolyticus]TPH24139.1 phage tail tape measure protein [Haemophilus haemolyticus]
MNNLQLSVLLNAIDKMSAPVRSASKSVHELSAKLKESKSIQRQLNQQNKQHQTAMKQYASAINPLKSKLDSLNQELEQAKQKAASYAQYMKNAQHPTAGFQKEVEKAKSAVKKLKQEQIDAANKLQQARQELAKSGISAEKLAQKQRELQKNTKSATDQIKNQEAALKKLNAKQAAYNQYRGQVEKLKDISGKAQIIGAQATAAGATMTAPLANSVRDFMGFEDAMLGVARQVQGLKDDAGNLTPEFEQWKDKIQSLSTELPLTTVQIANMIESAARMDVPKEQLEEFVRLNTQMATAFDAANPDELVEQYGKVTKNFKLSSAASRELADAINYLDDNAISKGTEIIGFMNRVSGISGIAKITEKNMAALGSTLQTAGAGEEDSATAVNAIFTRLSSATKKKPVRGALKAMGLDASQVELGMAKDAQGTLMKIVETVKKMPEQKRLGFIADLVGTEHTKTLALLASNTEEWRRQIELANSQAAKGSMGREFDTRMKALSSTWGIFKNQLFNLNATIGSALAPTLDNLMKKIGSVVETIRNWIIAHPKLSSNLMIFVGVIGGSLTIFGAFATILSFVLYPVARLFLGLSKLNILLPKFRSSMASVGGSILRGLLSPLKLLGFVFSTTGFAIAAAALLIYKFWNPIKAFFGGVWDGLKSGLAPVLEKFQPLGTAFGVVVGWIEKAVKWFTDLLSPVQSTKEDLDAAASAGKKFGEWIAAGIDFALKPLQLLMDGIKWVIDNMPGIQAGAKIVENAKQSRNEETNKVIKSGSITERTLDALSDSNMYSSGGYTGNGGKYEPMGIVHGGEYVMTKEATSRLGINTLNALNYGKQALIAGGLGISVATAAPVQVDTRAPISTRPMMTQSSQPMSVNITINAAQGMDERAIAQQVAKEIQRIENQRQARARSSMWDRA